MTLCQHDHVTFIVTFTLGQINIATFIDTSTMPTITTSELNQMEHYIEIT